MANKQIRCIICGTLMASMKDRERKCCIWCRRDYILSSKRIWSKGLTKDQIIRHLRQKVKKRKRKYETREKR